jgi:glycosyltransferase involved in cell wall biosynthesis
MAERKRIALNYRTGYDFAAGIVIYIQNIVKGFKMLDDTLRPHLTIIYSESSSIDELKNIDYPYIRYYKYKRFKRTIVSKGINKIFRELFNYIPLKRHSFPKDLDFLYPYFEEDETFYFKKRLYWKPDFQELHYPNYFSKEEINYSSMLMKKVAANPDYTLVLSSQDSLNDYTKFYGPYSNKVNLLPFISVLPDLSRYNTAATLKKYNIRKKYFLIANQFWPHKNHMLVLEALRETVKENNDFILVLTGKKNTYRDKKYFVNLEKFILDNNLKDHVKMTGFISREDQLVLMKNAIAVIQPSLFEGWSTVIEDCKALGQFVIASDLDVNKEQLKTNCLFFQRNDPAELSKHMIHVLREGTNVVPLNYTENIEAFKKDLVNIFQLDK